MTRRRRRHSPRRSYGSPRRQSGVFWQIVGASVIGIVGAELLMQALKIKSGSLSGMTMRPVRMPLGTQTGLPFYRTPD